MTLCKSAASARHQPAACQKMGRPATAPPPTLSKSILDNSCSASFRYRNILANRSVPILFVLVCFLVIANSNCDNVASTNAASGRARVEKRAGESSNELGGAQNDADPGEQQAAVAMHITSSSTSAPARNKFNALNVLREIYLDSNSKVTMFSPDETVQKFHPNGRYGRRSVDNFAEQHNEFGKLVADDQAESSRASGSASVGEVTGTMGPLSALLRSIGHNLDHSQPSAGLDNVGPPSERQLRRQLVEVLAAAKRNDDYEQMNQIDDQAARYQLEPSKLLRCSYLGLMNLYKCRSAGVQRAN